MSASSAPYLWPAERTGSSELQVFGKRSVEPDRNVVDPILGDDLTQHERDVPQHLLLCTLVHAVVHPMMKSWWRFVLTQVLPTSRRSPARSCIGKRAGT